MTHLNISLNAHLHVRVSISFIITFTPISKHNIIIYERGNAASVLGSAGNLESQDFCEAT